MSECLHSILECKDLCATDLTRLLVFINEPNMGNAAPTCIQPYKVVMAADFYITEELNVVLACMLKSQA